MGKFKDAMIEDMNVHQVQELVDKHKSGNDLGYVKFLEEELKKSEQKVIRRLFAVVKELRFIYKKLFWKGHER